MGTLYTALRVRRIEPKLRHPMLTEAHGFAAMPAIKGSSHEHHRLRL